MFDCCAAMSVGMARFPRMGERYRKYTRENLQEAVDASDSVMGVIRFFGMPQAGGTHSHLSRRIRDFDINTDHFVRYKGTGHPRRRSADDILQVLPFGSRRAKANHLRRAMVESGVSYQCSSCRVPAEWHGRPLTLHVDHISGDFHDNRLSNLRFLCPNCHAQTPNFAGRGKGSYGTAGTEDPGPSA
jgi:5-methylcytosine-specific restriction endonuclease McrA